ncbi:MAG: ABC transporter permease [Bacteroidia bacterium]|nr:ABC transporter permease [Bacteroidia bacterium]
MKEYINSIRSEHLKTKRSAAMWLCVAGGFFIPLIYLIGFIKMGHGIKSYGTIVNPWEKHFMLCWQNMALFLLPMGIILAASLITQIEYKNNAWKQLHVAPQKPITTYLAKLSVILYMTLKFFVFFNVGIFISAMVPAFMFDGGLPESGIPWLFFLKVNTKFFISCLPVIATHYVLSLMIGNFIAPLGFGLAVLIGTLIGFRWEYIYFSPYSFSGLVMQQRHLPINLYLLSLLYFLVLVVVGYYLHQNKKQKG